MTEPRNIRRLADGSIDFKHYDRIARSLRARDTRIALAGLTRAIAWFLRVFNPQPLAFGRSRLTNP